VCGFVGAIGPCKVDLLGPLNSIKHRGPDYQGVSYGRIDDSFVSLGHARLSILDLSDSANQPFENDSSTIKLVFNGEIYNHFELRRRLQKIGFSFRTSSDTEVIIKLYEHYGTECFKYLNGIFAIVLVDLNKRQLILARDHFGTKPLFYSYSKEKGFCFSSEVTPLKKILEKDFGIERTFLPEFLANGFLYEPQTGRKDLKKVRPGHYLAVEFENFLESEIAFYEPERFAVDGASLSQLLAEEVSLQCLADVKVGVFFSGGVDSTVIAAKAADSVMGLFAEYSPPNLDSKFVDQVAKKIGIDLVKTSIEDDTSNAQDVLNEFRMLAEGMDELNSNFTYVATQKLAALSKQNGFKVMLSGMGADEMFLGYPRHSLARYWNLLKKLGGHQKLVDRFASRFKYFDRKVDRLKSFISADNFIEAYTSLVGYFSKQEITRLLDVGDVWIDAYKERLYCSNLFSCDQSLIENMYSLDRFGYMSMNLAYTDRASMREGVEIRVPYLSPVIDQYSLKNVLRLNNLGKSELKKMLLPVLGKKLINRRKVGFNPPLKNKIDLLGFNGISEIFESGRLSDYLNMDEVNRILRSHFKDGLDETYKLNQLIFLSLWLDIN